MQVNVYEAKTRLSALLDLVEGGQPVVIARAGVPVARLLPIAGGKAQDNGVRFGGIKPRQLKLAADFHAPMHDDDLIGS